METAFSMRCSVLEAQLADLLQERAHRLTESMGRNWQEICSEKGEERLLMCFSLYLQCSHFFLKSGRYQRHLDANQFAALVALQLKAVQIHLAASLQEQQSAQKLQAEVSGAEGGQPGGPFVNIIFFNAGQASLRCSA